MPYRQDTGWGSEESSDPTPEMDSMAENSQERKSGPTEQKWELLLMSL